MLGTLAGGTQRAQTFVDGPRVRLQLECERRPLDPRPLAPPRQGARRRFAREWLMRFGVLLQVH